MNPKLKALESLRKHYKQKKMVLGDYGLKNNSKKRALEHFKNKKAKKSLPVSETKKSNTPYKKLSIGEYEAKYL